MWFVLVALLVLAVAALVVFVPRGRSHADEAPTVRGRPPGRD